ncbi:Bile acid 7-dehydroxylase 1/3 [Serratia odorifera]|uniref:Bile acid 7-dehydroxylase 1/3 n=1 Tax=Serratia odorifera TaxID=618 RepID=A0A3S4HP76_SEROD|nr:Bile acid 7-dehydroxylase 1/3 [Serratia odorifera]
MNFQIEGRVAVVTGGSSGIGFETLRLLLAEGARVAFCGRNQDKLDAALAQLREAFPQAEIVAARCDVLDAAQVAQFAAEVTQRFGGVDMLINNAGQGFVADFEQTPREALAA